MGQNEGIAGWLAGLMRGGGKKGGARSNEAYGQSELAELRRQVGELERQLREWKESGGGAPAPIVVEHIRIDRVVVDKIEYHNNFGALGIKELKGKLNIGANYSLTEDGLPEEAKEGLESLAEHQKNDSASGHSKPARPKVNVRAR